MTLGGMFEIMRDVDSCLLGSIYQVVTDAGWTNIWAQSVADKTNLWLNVVNTNIPFSALSGDTHASQYASWIAQYATSGSINLWSTAAVLKLQGMIASHYNSQNWGAVLAAAGSLAGLVSAAMNQDTTTGSTESKNMSSQLSTDNSALQPISDFGSAFTQMLTALANVLAQVGPG